MAETVTRTVPTANLGAIRDAVDKLNGRIVKRGLGETIVATYGEAIYTKVTNELGIAEGRWTTEVTITTPAIVLPGGWTLVALAQYGETPIPLVTDLGDTGLRYSDFTGTCDACGTARDRKTVFVVDSEAGERKFVGSTCVVDFLGRRASSVLWVPDLLREADEALGASGGEITFPVGLFVATAWAVTKVRGWKPAAESDSTKATTVNYFGVRTATEDWEREVAELLRDPATGAEAAAAIEWAKGLTATTSFDDSLKALASEEWVGRRGVGVLAYLPTAYARYLDREAVRATEAAAPTEPAPEGRVVVTGTVVGLKWQDTDFGTTLKWTVRDDRGFRVWSTVPSVLSDVERGDKVTFTVTLERSRDDASFAFGKRPSKAAILSEVAA
jgi:hypothetical protein